MRIEKEQEEVENGLGSEGKGGHDAALRDIDLFYAEASPSPTSEIRHPKGKKWKKERERD